MNLEKMNLVEMSSQEVKETTGGFLGFLITAIIIIAVAVFANNDNSNSTNGISDIRVGN